MSRRPGNAALLAVVGVLASAALAAAGPAAASSPAAGSSPGRSGTASTAACPAPEPGALRASPRPEASRTVALTFDDGPSPATTPTILATLRRHRVHATFFLLGAKAAVHPDLVRRIAAEGHTIGNHTWSHPMPHTGGALDRLPAARVAAELDRTSTVIARLTGRAPCLFRAPGGFDGGAVLRTAAAQRRLTVVNWTYDSRDWSAPAQWSPAFQRALVAGATGPARHPIVLLHDGPDGSYRLNTAAGLDRVITWYRQRGYAFTDPVGRRP